MSVAVLALMLTAASGTPPSGAFGPGELITYKVSWLGLPAGSADVAVGVETPEHPGTLPIVTNGRCDLVIYPIRDKIVSWWDPASSQSRGLEMYQDENHKRRRMRIDFQSETGKAQVMRQAEGEPAKKSEVDVPPGAVDVSTAVFFLRAARLSDGDTLSMPIFTGTKVFKGIAVVDGRGPLDTALGQVQAIRVRLRTEFSGKLSAREVRMWFSDDEAHIPVRMEADFSLGPVVVEWTDYKPGRPIDPSTLARSR